MTDDPQRTQPSENWSRGELPILGNYKMSFRYMNWRGVVATRRVGVVSFWFGSTEFHPEPQWFLKAVDLEKGELRDFAVRDMEEPTYVAEQ